METLLAVRNLTVTFGGVHALQDVDMQIRSGELVGLIGPNGAGKTTFVNAVTGFVAPSKGEVLFAGQVLTGRSPRFCEQRGIRRTFQTTHTFSGLTVAENLAAACSARTQGGWFQALARPLARRRVLDSMDAKVARLLDLLTLSDSRHNYPDELDHNQLQYLAVGMALAGEAKLICLDEPFAGLSAAEAAGLREVIHRWHSMTDASFLIIDHSLAHLFQSVRRVICFDAGRVLKAASPEEILRDPAVREVYLG